MFPFWESAARSVLFPSSPVCGRSVVPSPPSLPPAYGVSVGCGRSFVPHPSVCPRVGFLWAEAAGRSPRPSLGSGAKRFYPSQNTGSIDSGRLVGLSCPKNQTAGLSPRPNFWGRGQPAYSPHRVGAFLAGLILQPSLHRSFSLSRARTPETTYEKKPFFSLPR